ncbi:hypothetical protein NF701_04975 [Sphingomonadaceae bacterium OTU29THOMA1]|nr:hypothetical protein NF701_04975 [Sphingomonadaceae bacterium OTU29THOMA1]
MTSQDQKGGSGSTNIQIASVTTGLSYADVRDIAADLFERNFADLTAFAQQTARSRAEEIRDEILARLESDPKARPDTFNQVEKQIYLLEAQKAYALSGDDDLKSLLVNAIVGVSDTPERSKRSIVLGESIRVAPLLTPNQLRSLGASFAIWKVNFGVSSLEELFTRYATAIDLQNHDIEVTPGDILHLQYLGCGIEGTHQLKMDTLLRGDYPMLLQLGYSTEELRAAYFPETIPMNVIRPAMRDGTRLEIAIRRSANFDDVTGLTTRQVETSKRLLSERLIDADRLQEELTAMGGKARYLYDRWASSSLADFRLTSVGIAIGHTFVAERLAVPSLDIFL